MLFYDLARDHLARTGTDGTATDQKEIEKVVRRLIAEMLEIKKNPTI